MVANSTGNELRQRNGSAKSEKIKAIVISDEGKKLDERLDKHERYTIILPLCQALILTGRDVLALSSVVPGVSFQS